LGVVCIERLHVSVEGPHQLGVGDAVRRRIEPGRGDDGLAQGGPPKNQFVSGVIARPQRVQCGRVAATPQKPMASSEASNRLMLAAFGADRVRGSGELKCCSVRSNYNEVSRYRG